MCIRHTMLKSQTVLKSKIQRIRTSEMFDEKLLISQMKDLFSFD